MQVIEAREPGLLEVCTHLVAVPIEWEQSGREEAMEWQVRAWLEQHAGLDFGEATAVFQRARAWFCGFRQPSVAAANETTVARFRLLPMSCSTDDNRDAPSAA